MKDRFKFRVWSKECSEYVEQECSDCYIRYNGELECYNLKDTDEDCIYDGYPEDDAIVEQCTGLKDKNGKLIYEGDLIKSPNNSNLLEVIWEESSWHTKEYKPNGKNELILDSLVAFYGVEIIGNIHEKESK